MAAAAAMLRTDSTCFMDVLRMFADLAAIPPVAGTLWTAQVDPMTGPTPARVSCRVIARSQARGGIEGFAIGAPAVMKVTVPSPAWRDPPRSQ